MSDSENWAIGFKKQTEAKANAAYEEQQATAMRRAIIAEKMPQVWEDLMKTLQSYADAYNRHNDPRRKLTCHRPGTHVYLVRWDAGPEVVTANYNPQDKTIAVKGGGYAEGYFPNGVFIDEGRVELVSQSARRVCTLDDIAKTAFESGLVE